MISEESDVLKSNVVFAMNFDETKYLSYFFRSNQPEADQLAATISECMKKHPDLNTIIIVLEATSVYCIHIASFLSTCETLMPYKSYVYCVNPKMTANYRFSRRRAS